MALKSVAVTFEVPDFDVSNRPWVSVTGTVQQCLSHLKDNHISEGDVIDIFYNGTNQTIIFRRDP